MRKNGKNIEDYIDDCEVTLSGISQYYIDLTELIEKVDVFNSKISVLLDIIPIIGILYIFLSSSNALSDSFF